MYGLGAMTNCPGGPGCPGSPDQPDVLDMSGLLALQGGEAGPSLSPGIDLSPSAVSQETAGGIPLNVSVASLLGTTGSTANTVMLIGGGVAVIALALFLSKGGRRR